MIIHNCPELMEAGISATSDQQHIGVFGRRDGYARMPICGA